MNITAEKAVLSVSQLNRRCKQLLETHLPLVWVSGELSNFAQPGSGHWYFSLKDDKAQVRCAMFRQANQRLRWQPQAGKQVLVRARVSLYEGRGDYQLIVEHMEDAGTGALQQAYEILKAKLQQEGLFNEARKQPLPQFPQRIGVITSATGAAIHDILSVLARRYPIAPVTILPVAVQGDTAAAEMITALEKAVAINKFDVLIIGRGGGSLEDLWAFNDEALARAISDCPIPIISAVGHEVDFTICDFVADVRAPTPSASAEIATPDMEEWQQAIDVWQEQLVKRQLELFRQYQQALVFLKRRLRHPGERIQTQKLRLQTAKSGLIHSISSLLATRQQQLSAQQHSLVQQHPQHRIRLLQQQNRQLSTRIKTAMINHLNTKGRHLAGQGKLLDAVSPLAVLGRGYSIVSRVDDASIVKTTDQISIGDTLTTRLDKGSFISEAIEINNEHKT